MATAVQDKGKCRGCRFDRFAFVAGESPAAAARVVVESIDLFVVAGRLLTHCNVLCFGRELLAGNVSSLNDEQIILLFYSVEPTRSKVVVELDTNAFKAFFEFCSQVVWENGNRPYCCPLLHQVICRCRCRSFGVNMVCSLRPDDVCTRCGM